jgi:hypothetical protein
MASGWPMPKIRDQQSSRLVVCVLGRASIGTGSGTEFAECLRSIATEQQSASDASLTEQQWRQRVEDARARSAEFVARSQLESGRYCFHQQGLIFQGLDDGEHQWGDFRSATESEIAALHRSTPNY